MPQLLPPKIQQLFKTLLLHNSNHQHYLFLIPLNQTLHINNPPHLLNQNKFNLIPLHQLKQLTPYLRGGSSPIGIK
ncbi:YbaK/EbsC family protein, partial [Staphylococcus epidermidis]|uniref:YbaK/EbsC family protein n=1 Tax=Staphylococcus epidermidis TaxID=1282 RepID=UPI0037D9BE2C